MSIYSFFSSSLFFRNKFFVIPLENHTPKTFSHSKFRKLYVAWKYNIFRKMCLFFQYESKLSNVIVHALCILVVNFWVTLHYFLLYSLRRSSGWKKREKKNQWKSVIFTHSRCKLEKLSVRLSSRKLENFATVLTLQACRSRRCRGYHTPPPSPVTNLHILCIVPCT